ncbi:MULTISPECIES: hypothetical protein [unclassified Bifidobacterium]|uniref:hypothetical protein n=1 Tax=unclassified Bifidobacterium TaxID=2608897 RepID=UPI0023FA498E|nr:MULTISPECIES: hypothetical protein [unclassified Bifidobacterium]WEV65867.1 hypothetical protein OZX71_00385 [Bifidobacterium sp. ESL0764]WEV75345.1 hypothetical protein OZX75_06870 [Bifidobacterium sp. ESL0800]
MEKIRHNHIEWLREITHDDSINRISQQAGIPYATLYKRFKSSELATDEIISIARSYGINPVDALVKTGVISSEEATGVRGDNALRLCDIESIAKEIVRRDNEKSQLKSDDKYSNSVAAQDATTKAA